MDNSSLLIWQGKSLYWVQYRIYINNYPEDYKMTIGLKIHEIVDEEELRKRAAERKAESDKVLEMIYTKLIDTIKRKKDVKKTKP